MKKKIIKRKVKPKDIWVLNTGLYEIHFVNDVAIEVAIDGTIFKAN